MKPEKEPLIPKHGGYRKLKSFQVSQLVYDVTVRFCDRYIDRRSRTGDQMVQAARSGVQNIAEGSQAAGTSKKTELKLTNVARASLEELKLDYEDFLRQRGLPLWPRSDPRRADLIARRCASAEEVAEWVREQHAGQRGQSGLRGQNPVALSVAPSPSPRPSRSTEATTSTQSVNSIAPAASAAPTRSTSRACRQCCPGSDRVACGLLDRQLASLAAAFEREGGFTERLYRVRKNARDGK